MSCYCKLSGTGNFTRQILRHVRNSSVPQLEQQGARGDGLYSRKQLDRVIADRYTVGPK